MYVLGLMRERESVCVCVCVCVWKAEDDGWGTSKMLTVKSSNVVNRENRQTYLIQQITVKAV